MSEEITQKRRKVNDDYGIYYNQTHESLKDPEREASPSIETYVMSRVDWIVALRNIFYRVQIEGRVKISVLLHHLKQANFDLVPSTLYELQHDTHEKGYSLLQVMDRFREAQQ